MHAHLTRWQRFQVKAMGPALWATAALALISTGYFAGTLITERHHTH